MSDVYPPAESNGPYGTAAVRARKRQGSDEAAAVSPQAREARVAELRRQYLAGTYEVDAGKLSTALIRRHLAKDG